MHPLTVSNDYSSNYSELIQSFYFVSMENRRLRAIAYEEIKLLNGLNPNFVREIFYHSPNLTHRK